MLMLLLCNVFTLSAAEELYAQHYNVTLSLRNATVKEAVDAVTRQTGIAFSYESSVGVMPLGNVEIRVDGGAVDAVLGPLFADKGIAWQVVDGVVILTRQNSPPQSDSGRRLTVRGRITAGGRVLDEQGAPVIGATVMVKGTQTGVSSDVEGNYEIVVPGPGSVLVFNYLGYQPQEIAVGNRTQIDVRLAEDNNVLDDVVVIGYGAVKKSDLTGSVSNVKMSDIRDVPNTSVDQALQGRIAGVDIMSTSGAPGATTSIRVRGTRSISASNEPLIVVDGVIDAVSDLNDINSADIEQISVLKDASSTAIYGSRGANGVIIVTTRQGVTSKPSVTAKAEFGVSKLARDLDLMDAQEFVRYLNDRNYFSSRDPQRPPRFDPSEYGRGTDWIDEITRTALYQNYNLSVSGRSQKSSYFAALGGNDTQGIVDGSGFRRITARLNLSYDFAKWLTVGFKGSYTFRDENPNRATIGGANIWDGAVYLAPTMGPKDYINPLYENGVRIDTPRAKIDCNENESERMTNTDVLEFTIKPVRGLIIKSQNSYMVYQRHDYQFWPSYLPKRTEGEGADAYRYEGDARRLTSENTVSYSKKFASGHYFDAMAGFSATHETANFFSLKAEGLLTDDLKWNNMNSIGSKENYNASTSSNKVVRESVLMRLNYNYKSRYRATTSR